MSPQRFRKKPVVIEAMQFDGSHDSAGAIIGWAGAERADKESSNIRFSAVMHELIVPTLEGDHRARPGDWIIRGVAGEFYPCKPHIFVVFASSVFRSTAMSGAPPTATLSGG